MALAQGSGSRRTVAGTTATATAGLTRRAEQTGLVVASGMAPGTFARSLGPRSVLDQGLVTGLATTLNYVLTVAAQDALEAIGTAGAADATPGGVQRRALLANAAAIPAGMALHRLLPPGTTSTCCAAWPARSAGAPR